MTIENSQKINMRDEKFVSFSDVPQSLAIIEK